MGISGSDKIKSIIGPWVFVWMILLLFAGLSPARGNSAPGEEKTESPEKTPPVEMLDTTAINAKLDSIKSEIIQMRTPVDARAVTRPGVASGDVKEREGILKALQSAYEKLLIAQAQKDKLEEGEKHLNERQTVAMAEGLGLKPPYTLDAYDGLLDQLEVVQQEKEHTGPAIRMAAAAQADAAQRLAQARKELDVLPKEDADTADGDLPESWLLKNAQLKVELVQAVLQAETIVHGNLEKTARQLDVKIDLLKRQVGWVYDRLEFNETDLKRQLAVLETGKADLEKTQQKLLEEKQQVEQRWLQAQRAVVDNVVPEEAPALEAALQARESWLNTYHMVADQFQHRIQLLDDQKTVWRNRYALIKGISERDKLAGWSEALENSIRSKNRRLALEQKRQITLQTQIVALEKQLSDETLPDSLKPHLQTHILSVKKQAERRNEYMGAILAALQMDQRFQKEIEHGLSKADWLIKVWAFMATSRAWGAVIVFLSAVLAALIMRWLMNRVLLKYALKSKFHLDDVLLKVVNRPVVWTLLLAGAAGSTWWYFGATKGTAVLISVVQTLVALMWGVALTRILRHAGLDMIRHWRLSGREGTEMIRLGENVARLIIMVGTIFLFLSI